MEKCKKNAVIAYCPFNFRGYASQQKAIERKMYMENLVLESVEEFVPPQKERRNKFKEQAILRTGQIGFNSLNSLMVVDFYEDSQNVWIRFPKDNYLTRTTWQQFCKGTVKNPYDRSVFNVGCLGEGSYKIKDENDKPTRQYKTWVAMLQRTSSQKYKIDHPSYADATVCEEWLNFQNFAKWFDENYYEVGNERMELDKDILVKNNKVYSPQTCVFVPKRINLLFLNRGAHRGSLPIGVKRCTRNKAKYEVQARNGTGKRIYKGIYNSPEEAFQAFKVFKEEVIRNTVEEFKGMIPDKLYRAMYQYKIEITD